MTLTEAREAEGKRVMYTGGWRPEYGVITSLSTGAYVFVRYDGDPFSKATFPGDLELVDE